MMINVLLISVGMGELSSPVSMGCMHGDTYVYKCRKLIVTILGRTRKLPVGLVPQVACPMILGRDSPYSKEVLQQVMGTGGKQQSLTDTGEDTEGMTRQRGEVTREASEEDLDIEKLMG